MISWIEKVKIRKTNQTPPLVLEQGEHILEVVKDPSKPITTKFGEKLVYQVRRRGENQVRAMFIPYRDEVSESSALGQLKALTERHGSLKGKLLRVVVVGKGKSKRYSFNVIKKEQLKTDTCPNCEQPITPEMRFCSSCGFKLKG